MRRNWNKAIANTLLVAGGGAILLLFVSAIIGAVHLGWSSAVDRLTLLHKIGITVMALVLGLALLNWSVNVFGRRLFPHLADPKADTDAPNRKPARSDPCHQRS